MHEAVQVGMEGSHRPPGRPRRMRAYRRRANRGIWEDGSARRQPWGRVGAWHGPHVPAESIHCVKRRHAHHAPHMHVHGRGGRVEQPKVLPRNGGAHRVGESLNHFLGENAIPEGMRATNVSRLRAVCRRPPPTGACANRH
eukprot:357660-Chlamydomonas_euryale.AAC.3